MNTMRGLLLLCTAVLPAALMSGCGPGLSPSETDMYNRQAQQSIDAAADIQRITKDIVQYQADVDRMVQNMQQ